MNPVRLAVLLEIVATIVLSSRVGAAQPSFAADETAIEDRYEDGDLDGEDHVALRLRPGTTDVHGQSWVSLLGYARALRSGKRDLGALVVVGLALDRIAAGPVHRLSDPARPSGGASAQGPPTPRDSASALLPAALARDCVAAALRASGLGLDDSRLDAVVARARSSALLPETRFRAMRLWNDASHTTTLAATDGTTLYDAVGANLALELRLTWRLDRLVYGGDEPALERLRLERTEARARLATRTLESLFAWARATRDAEAAVHGSPEEGDATLRRAETEAALDVLTAGWFSAATAGAGAP